MSTLVLDYAFNGSQLANPDGSLAVTATGCTAVPGPGSTALGTLAGALSFAGAGKAQVELPVASLNAQKFCVRTVIKVDTPVTTRQNLVESSAIPFAMFLNPIAGSTNFQAVVSVAPKAHGWTPATTQYSAPLELGTWYLVDLVYDTDTLAVAIDGAVVAVAAFPNGAIDRGVAKLNIGTWMDGARWHFEGSMAALQLHAGIPADLEALLDERRSSPEWFITYKHQQIKSKLGFGAPTGPITYDAAIEGYTQLYAHGLIMYAEPLGAAFEMHGAIFGTYQALADKSVLGYLASDEIDASTTASRKSVFSRGAIYWSGATGAVPVLGQIYLDYAAMGDAAWIGLPVSPATAVPNGKQQIFQRARMFHKSGQPRAHEVHGAILERFLATGGVQTWGFPTSNEQDVRKNNVAIGRSSDFENCTFYWKSGVGAFEVHGAIREKYRSLSGPLGELGFPTSDEVNIPGASAPARANTFQHGSLLWFGSDPLVCRKFKIRIGRVSTRDSEGFGMGQNDLYFRVLVQDNGHQLLNKRYPSSGDYGGRDIVELNQDLPLTITPNDLGSNVKVTFDIWESDSGAPFGEGDDHLGTTAKVLNAANAWGMRENQGVMNTGAFGKVNSVTWSVRPDVNLATLTENEKWWGPNVQNRGTPSLTYTQYGAAFRDIDPTPEDWDATDWLDKAFYELVAEDISAGGNCFGMALEAIYALKNRSLLSMPLNRFDSWNQVVGEFNVRHQYQVGAAAIWWFVGQFLSGNTHDPVDVFRETRDALARGDNPVVCLSQNYDFSGAPHCVMAVGHDTSSKPWKLEIRDPNFVSGNVRRFIEVDPDRNTFRYVGGSTYEGGEWSGGRLHYMPYCLLNERPRTPIWDAILLLLAGTIVIVGNAETEEITDENGIDLSAFGADSIARLKNKEPLANKLVPFSGFNGSRALASEVFLRTQPRTRFRPLRPLAIDPRVGANVTFGELARANVLPAELRALTTNPRLFRAVAERDLKSIVHDRAVMSVLDAPVSAAIRKLAARGSVGNSIRHKLKGKAAGQLRYAGRNRLTDFVLSAPIAANEAATMTIDDLGTTAGTVAYKSATGKQARIDITNKLGVGGDTFRITIDKLPVDASHELRVNVKPGMGGLDILSASAGAHPEVTINATIDGQRVQAVYTLPFDGGVRLRPSTMLANRELKVGRIDDLFGAIADSTMLKPR